MAFDTKLWVEVYDVYILSNNRQFRRGQQRRTGVSWLPQHQRHAKARGGMAQTFWWREEKLP